MKKLLIMSLLCAVFAIGAEVSGKWSGTAHVQREDGSTNNENVSFTLKQNGGTVTGTASGPNEDHSIQTGKVEGNTVTFELTRSEERRVGKECRSRWSP